MSVLCVTRWKPEPGSVMRPLGPELADIFKIPKGSTLTSRAGNMRFVSRALAFAILVAVAALPNASQAQVMHALNGAGSPITVYRLNALVKPDFNATLDYP